MVAAAIKGLKIAKTAGPIGVVIEMMKASSGFCTRWMTDLINNIPDDWRKGILVSVYKGKCDPFVCGSYRAIKLLEQFGFMPDKGTTDAIFIMRQVQEKH